MHMIHTYVQIEEKIVFTFDFKEWIDILSFRVLNLHGKLYNRL